VIYADSQGIYPKFQDNYYIIRNNSKFQEKKEDLVASQMLENFSADFKKLAKEIQEVTETNIWNLYRYIYESKELKLLNESMYHGHSKLRNHLVVIANLIVQDFIHESE
jgi:hypothetical protein